MIDTDVFSAGLHGPSLLANTYEPLIVGRPAFISFQTVAEIRFGAGLRGWGLTAGEAAPISGSPVGGLLTATGQFYWPPPGTTTDQQKVRSD